MSVIAAFVYLSGSPQAVQGFARVGYPQHLRIILGIAKLLGAITLVIPGVIKFKEWAYAGFTFASISACVAHYVAKDGPVAFMPRILLLLLVASYVPRPANRQGPANHPPASAEILTTFSFASRLSPSFLAVNITAPCSTPISTIAATSPLLKPTV